MWNFELDVASFEVERLLWHKSPTMTQHSDIPITIRKIFGVV